MKKTVQLSKGLIVCSLLAFIIPVSCKKDSLNSRELLIYVAGDYGSVNNTKTVSLVHTPLSVVGSTTLAIPVYATHAVVADVDAYIYPDTRSIATYNQQNGTAYLELPQANYRVNNDVKRRISAGNLVSTDSIQIEILHPEQLTNTNGYLMPFTVTKIDGEDKGVQISTNQATVYVAIPYQFNNVQATQTPLVGTLVSRTAWSVTVSNTTSGALGPAMLDGNNSTAWRSSNSTTAAKNVILNMGSQQAISGFQIVSNYVAVAENATQMTISTSNDNVTYTVQGVWNGTGPASTSSAASPDIKGVNFIAPVTAQYFRFDITALVSGGRVGIGELNAVQ
jgi:F5/8 type C domain/Domain of unknown function (DUF1735)